MIFRAGAWDPATTSPEQIFSSNFLCLELMAREERTQVDQSVSLLLDITGLLRCRVL